MPINTSRPARRRLLLPVAVTGAAASLLIGTPALAATSSTTVTPAGDAYRSSLTSGTTASLSAGTTTVTCSGSVATGQVSAAPGNSNPSGPVGSPTTPPTFTDCTTGSFLLTPTVSSNNTNGDWIVSLQYDPAGSTGSLTIPRGGQVVKISGLASCTTTVAPNGPVTINGTWTPGTATAPPKLVFSNISVPISVTGGLFCPTSATSGTFSASYDITDTSNPAAQITVGS